MPASLFDNERQRLFALAYRLLGSVAEAEDAVQETFLKWHAADQAHIESASAWLTTCCTRQCIDMLRSARRARTDYVGTWLPEPLQMTDDASPDQLVELANSVGTAFMLMLERLTPKERAAYLLHEVLELGHDEVASALSISQVACRKLVSRAKRTVGGVARFAPPPQAQQQVLLQAFQRALTTGSLGPLITHLNADILLCADGGGKVSVIPGPVRGREAVLAALATLHGFWRDNIWLPSTLSGVQGFMLCLAGRIEAAVTFSFATDGAITGIFITRNPDKLVHLAMV